MRKQIDLPKTVIAELTTQAKKVHPKMKVKPFMEMLLTDIANKKLGRTSSLY